MLQSIETTLACWASLLCKTTMPKDMSSTDCFVIDAFRVLDSAFNTKDGLRVLSRLAYVQLSVFLTRSRTRSSLTGDKGWSQQNPAIAKPASLSTFTLLPRPGFRRRRPSKIRYGNASEPLDAGENLQGPRLFSWWRIRTWLRRLCT